ncbi:unnamed protein product [Cuscuta europaea]|uniref:BED-type domain-containing protein n=1 Tax=Cuscuta europaea TaxID=41803 RepID=A0A9P1E951_CUSEU|nr:unnamed protein product [Cuscuta europaea]
MDRPRYSVDMGNLECNRTKELARKRSCKGKSHIGSSSQSRDDFDTGYAKRDGDAMTDEQLEQELHRHNSRVFQDQPRTIDEEELEDDDVEEVIPESHDDDDEEGGGSHDADETASSQTGTKKSKSELMANNFSKWKDPNTGNWTATCNWCKKNYSLGISGGYGSATRHLKSKHPVEYAKLGGGTGKQTQISRFANNQQTFGNFSYNDAQNLTDDFDVLNWWKGKERMFSVLAKMAKQVLSMPVSTVAVEQEFCSAGNVLTQCRTRLGAESLEMLICYHDWLKTTHRAQEIDITPSQHFMNESITEGGSTYVGDSD